MLLAVIGTALAGLVIVGTCLFVGLRVEESARIGVFGAAVAYLIWSAGSVGLLLGMPEPLFWAGARPLALIGLSVAVIASPGVQRTGREWLDVLLDGAITSSGMFGTLWFIAHEQTWLPITPRLDWMDLWLGLQLLLMIPVAGLLNRTVPGRRLGPAMTFWITALVMAGDIIALLSGRPAAGIVFWMGGGLLVSLGLMVLGAVYFENTFDDPERPRQLRWWQLPLLPVACYALDPSMIDEVVAGLAGLIFATMCANLLTQSRRNERLWDSLSTRSRLYRDALRDSQDVILMLDDTFNIEYANAAAEFVLGTQPETMIGHQVADWGDEEQTAWVRGKIAQYDFGGDGQLRLESKFRGDDGVVRTIEWAISERAEQPGYALSGRDFSERNHLQRELVTAARTDALTGLLNRAAFLTEVDERLDAGQGVALMFIDLDQFKLVNDTTGHASGDLMLRRSAESLNQAAGPGDLVSRLGGDEFGILAASSDGAAAMERAQSVVHAFSGFDPDPVGRPPVSVSIGVVVSQAGRGADLLRDADLAMYRAKQRGGACAVRFEPWMSERVLERSRLLTELESVIQHGGLMLHMQPVVSLPEGQWTGFEALVRWPTASRLRPPDEFLPLAQESGLIVPMGTWVLNEALRQLATVPGPELTLAVNVSAQQLSAHGFSALVLTALRNNGIAPGRLTLEITEQTAIQDLGRTTSRLTDLRAEGIRVAIDDFGTGFSSMQYLARLAVDTLKIDRTVIGGLGEDGEHDVLVRSMIGLAAEMGFDIVAEGVETQLQADLLIEYGCRLAQGYLFSRPRPLAELGKVLATGAVSAHSSVPEPRGGRHRGVAASGPSTRA